jgi:hypothetical protein
VTKIGVLAQKSEILRYGAQARRIRRVEERGIDHRSFAEVTTQMEQGYAQARVELASKECSKSQEKMSGAFRTGIQASGSGIKTGGLSSTKRVSSTHLILIR